MDKQSNTRKDKQRPKRVLHLWDGQAIEQLMNGVLLAALENRPDVDERQEDNKHTASDVSDLQVCDRMFCLTCSTKFEERDEQTEHFKSDWHRFNLKRRLKGQESVSELKFEEITNSGDLSSISGSESSDEDLDQSDSEHLTVDEVNDEGAGHVEGIGKKHPRVFLRNDNGELFSIYRCVIHGKKNRADTTDELLSMVRDLPNQLTWIIVMLAGGHFAAAVFKGNTLVEHKTFHRYVIRAKRGTVQSSHDSKGHAPKSGGATLRRYNEAALSQDIQELLSSWSEHIKSCHRIFIRAPTNSKSVFYGGRMPILDKNDIRVRLIPFQTHRPTLKEIHRVHDQLASAECYGTDSSLDDHITMSPRKVVPKPVIKKSPQKSDRTNNTSQDETPTVPSDPDDPDLEFTLSFEQETLDTSSLRTFEATKKPRKKKKKNKSDDMKQSGISMIQGFSPDSIKLHNDLYRACKSGDTGQLQTLLQTAADKNEIKSCSQNDVTPHHSTETSAAINPDLKHLDPDSDADHSQIPQRVTSDQMIDPDKTQTSQQTASCQRPGDNTEEDESMSKQLHAQLTVDGLEVSCKQDLVGSSSTSISSGHDLPKMLNCPLGGHGLTLLHVAAQVNHKEAVSLLMEFGADPSIRDGQGQLPYNVAATKDTRNEFRRFMAKHPDKFDYQKAQIPSPLSEEQEKEKKAREVEKRKMLKKAKKERLKEQKLQEEKQREEEEERKRFLALSDREKRALAAEKRLAAQAAATGQKTPVLSRCFKCATDITGKVPFEYSEYLFCSTQCLKQHRLENSSKKS